MDSITKSLYKHNQLLLNDFRMYYNMQSPICGEWMNQVDLVPVSCYKVHLRSVRTLNKLL